MASSLILLALLATPIACNGRANSGGDMCQTVLWGGFNGTPDCHGIASQVIQGQHRACSSDADCAIIAASACSAHAVNINAAQLYMSYPPPCNHPFAATCMPVQWRQVCNQGCCQPSSAGATPVGPPIPF